MNDIVKLRKQGKFYTAYEDDALALSEITGYRVVNGRLGFPVNSLGKVSELLNDSKVNYKIIEKDKEIDKMIFPKNNYNKYLKLVHQPHAMVEYVMAMLYLKQQIGI